MKITIEKDEKGNNYILDEDGQECCYSQSREITGHTNESGDGIFEERNEEEKFGITFGEYSKNFYDEFELFNFSDPKSVEAEIKKRINLVRGWVKECKKQAYTHTFVVK